MLKSNFILSLFLLAALTALSGCFEKQEDPSAGSELPPAPAAVVIPNDEPPLANTADGPVVAPLSINGAVASPTPAPVPVVFSGTSN